MSNLCNDQDEYNHTFYKALNYSRKQDDKKMANAVGIYLIIHTIFLIWGVILAIKSQPPENRVIHITLAIVFSPVYVLAYYIKGN